MVICIALILIIAIDCKIFNYYQSIKTKASFLTTPQ